MGFERVVIKGKKVCVGRGGDKIGKPATVVKVYVLELNVKIIKLVSSFFYYMKAESFLSQGFHSQTAWKT